MQRPDPRGPVKQAVSIEETPSETKILLSCGHTGHLASHFHYKIGGDLRCFECGRIELAEFLKQSSP